MKYLILDNIRSAHNVGSIFRTADAASVAKIFICGYTPAPTDRFKREVESIKKTSLGATKTVAWEAADDIEDVIRCLKREGVTIVAVEQTKTAVALFDFTPPSNCAYILGNEIDGVQPAVLQQSDYVVEIPMSGSKESLNVAVAAGIMLFHR